MTLPAAVSRTTRVSSLRCGHLRALSTLPPMPALRCLTWTGAAVRGLTLGALHDLCAGSPHLRRLVLDRTDQWPPYALPLADDRQAGTDHLPAVLAEYAGLSVFDSALPSELVARALGEAKALESVALFGYTHGRRLDWRDVKMLERACPSLLRVD